MTVDNLRKIFTYYRSQGAANCRCESTSYLRPLVTDFSLPQISMGGGGRLDRRDNFCFLTGELLENIIKQIEKIVPEIEENYGSADFIVDNFAVLKKDASFQDRFDKYPVEFFVALRYLQMSGAPEKGGLVFVADSRNRMNAALLIAHTVTAKNPTRCEAEGTYSLAPPRRIVNTVKDSRPQSRSCARRWAAASRAGPTMCTASMTVWRAGLP